MEIFEWELLEQQDNTGKNKEVYDLIHKYFRGAAPFYQVVDRCCRTLKREYGMVKDKTIAAVSVCPDELNNQVINKIEDSFGYYFRLGGLSGYPFSGETGFDAFGDHIPDKGAAFIFFGPHTGVGPRRLGFVHRHGQARDTLSCGSAIGAYNSLLKGADADLFSDDDFQQSFVRRMLSKKLDKITVFSPEPAIMEILLDESYAFIVRQAERIKEKFGAEKIFLMGAFILNTPPDMPDFLRLKCLEVI